MNEYHMLPLDSECSKEDLIRRYNDAVATIWHYKNRYCELAKDYDSLMSSYEDVSNQLYG